MPENGLCYVLDTIVESGKNCVCLGTVYGVIGKIQILSGNLFV